MNRAVPSSRERTEPPAQSAPGDMSARDLERLAERVYRLLERDLLRSQERLGRLSARWR